MDAGAASVLVVVGGMAFHVVVWLIAVSVRESRQRNQERAAQVRMDSRPTQLPAHQRAEPAPEQPADVTPPTVGRPQHAATDGVLRPPPVAAHHRRAAS